MDFLLTKLRTFISSLFIFNIFENIEDLDVPLTGRPIKKIIVTKSQSFLHIDLKRKKNVGPEIVVLFFV